MQQETDNCDCQQKGEVDGCRQGLEAGVSMDALKCTLTSES